MLDPASPGTVEPGASLIDSPYEPAYALARRLLKGTTTPYDYASKIKRYLDSPAYHYDENPPVSRYPLLTFLFKSKRGYCQQFAGAGIGRPAAYSLLIAQRHPQLFAYANQWIQGGERILKNSGYWRRAALLQALATDFPPADADGTGQDGIGR